MPGYDYKVSSRNLSTMDVGKDDGIPDTIAVCGLVGDTCLLVCVGGGSVEMGERRVKEG